MSILIVSVKYNLQNSAGSLDSFNTGMSLPVKVIDINGEVIFEALASNIEPVKFNISEKLKTVFVRLTWPSGKNKTRRINLTGNHISEITFSDMEIENHEWAAWAAPRLKQNEIVTHKNKNKKDNIESHPNTWLIIWKLDGDQWIKLRLAPKIQFKSKTSRQIDFVLDKNSYLLQIGGPNIPWRFVTLPSGGTCRIFLKLNDTSDQRLDPLDILVSGFSLDAEALMEFLTRNAVSSVKTMARSRMVATSLFSEKFEDPISAIAGAYYLLRVGNWEEIPMLWWENLSSNFKWIPDASILHCVRLLRGGLSSDIARQSALNLFKTCLEKGWPVYEEGLLLLKEAGALLRNIAELRDAELYARVESLVVAKSSASASLSFYGRFPSKPSAVLWVGMPNTPRRRKIPSAKLKTELLDSRNSMRNISDSTTVSNLSRQMNSLSFTKEFIVKSKKTSKNLVRNTITTESEVQIDNITSSSPPILTDKKVEDKIPKEWFLLKDIGDE